MWPRVYCETGIFWPCDSSVLCACAALEENKTWDQLSPDCGWKPFIWISVPGEPLGAAHRHEAISLVWWIPSITALTQNCWLQPHTERVPAKLFSAEVCKWAQSLFFRSWSYQYAGWVSATITQSIGFPWTITIPLSPSNYYRAPTSDPLIASRPISYTQLASSCYVHAPLSGSPVLIQRPQNLCGGENKSNPPFPWLYRSNLFLFN